MTYAALVTRSSLAEQLRAAGVVDGDVVLAHTSLSRLGLMVGAARALIDALSDAVGASGTIMMPTYSGELSDPAEWRHPPVPEEWVEAIRRETPPYDDRLTPTRRMGVTAELFRHRPDAMRSAHPQSSFTAAGPQAAFLVGDHPLDDRFGPSSPLGKLCEARGKSILVAAPTNTNSLLYLTEHAMPWRVRCRRQAPLTVAGRTEWVAYDDVVCANHWFADATAFLLKEGIAHEAPAGAASCLVCPAAETIAAVTAWRLRHKVI